LAYLHLSHRHPLPPHSLPTRRSSDLARRHPERVAVVGAALRDVRLPPRVEQLHDVGAPAERRDRKPAPDDLAERGQVRDDAVQLDRKSTRLNSSHVSTSYAVFCLKKK